MEYLVLAAVAATIWWLIDRQSRLNIEALERINERLKQALGE